MNVEKINSRAELLQEKHDFINIIDLLIVHVYFRSSKESLQRIIKANILENKSILRIY